MIGQLQPSFKATPLLDSLHVKAQISLPGINQKAFPPQDIIAFFNQFFTNLFATVHYVESHFPDIRRFAIIQLFARKRDEEIELDLKYRQLIEAEADRFASQHKSDKDFRVKLRVHLLDFAHELVEKEAKRATKLTLITRETIGKPLREMKFENLRWIKIASEKDPEKKQEQLVKELKEAEDGEMRRVVLQHFRPKHAGSLTLKSSTAVAELDARINTCVFDNLAILCYEILEKKFETIAPLLSKTGEIPLEHVDLAIRYYIDKLVFKIERMKRLFFAESLGLELSSPRSSSLKDINGSLEKLNSDFSKLKIVLDDGQQTHKKEGSSSSILDFFLSKPKPAKEEPSGIKVAPDSMEWKSFCGEWIELGEILQTINLLLPRKKQKIQDSFTKTLQRTFSKSRITEPEPDRCHSNSNPPRPTGSFVASSPRPILSPRKVSNSSILRLAPASPFNKSPRSGIGSPREADPMAEASPRRSELEEMMASQAIGQTPRSSARDLTSISVTFELAQEVILTFNKKFPLGFLKKPDKKIERLSQSVDQADHSIESENYIPIVEFNSTCQALSGYFYEILLCLEKLLEVSLNLIDIKRPNPLVDGYIAHLNQVEAELCEKKIRPLLAEHKKNFEIQTMLKGSISRDDYSEQYAGSAWMHLRELAPGIRSRARLLSTIPMISCDLKTPIEHRHLKEILNQIYTSPNQNIALAEFIHLVSQRSLRDGIAIQLGTITRNPYSLDKSSEAVFWEGLFKYATAAAEKIAAEAQLQRKKPYETQGQALKNLAKTKPSDLTTLFFDEHIDVSASLRSLSKQTRFCLPEIDAQAPIGTLDHIKDRVDQLAADVQSKISKCKIITDEAYLANLQKWQESAKKGSEYDQRAQIALTSLNWKSTVERVQEIVKQISELWNYMEYDSNSKQEVASILKKGENGSKIKRKSGVTFGAAVPTESKQLPQDETLTPKKLQETLNKAADLLGQTKQAIVSLPLPQARNSSRAMLKLSSTL